MKEKEVEIIPKPYEVSKYNETTGAKAVFPAKASTEL